jgi:mono/diheme cytochrome c family protein
MTPTHKTTMLMSLAIAAFSAAMLSAIAPSVQDGGVSSEQKKARVERGAHLVKTMGCNDCHTPLKMGPRGPEPDLGRARPSGRYRASWTAGAS